MLNKLLKAVFGRNFILISAILLGLFFNDWAFSLQTFNIYILATLMVFSTTGISAKGILPLTKSFKTMALSVLLGYFIFSSLLLVLSYFFIDNKMIFYGMIVIAASPPGVAVIPFTNILNGDMNYTMVGTLGAYLASIILSPLIITIFSGNDSLSSMQLVIIMVKIIVLPMILSRLLLHKKILPTVAKYRGRIVDFGFATIIYVAVGLNRDIFFNNFKLLGIISFIFVVCMFGLGELYQVIGNKLKIKDSTLISQKLLLTIKSSGFTASASLAIFGKEASIPSAVLAVLVLVYLIYLSIRNKLKTDLH